MAAGRIFVCYRREDSAGHAGRLYDRLNQRFAGRVFMDVASIGVGTRWAEVIEETLRSCEVAIILIGKRWLDSGQDGVRRIDQPEDPTRAEIRTALRLNLRMVPLLVSGAAVPDRSELPADVAAIAEWQALRIDDDDFDHDASRLIRALEHQLGDHAAQRQPDGASQKQGDAQRLAADAESAIDQPQGTLRRRLYFGFSLGSLRLWVTFGVAALALIVVQVGGLLPARPPVSAGQSTPGGAVTGASDPGESPKATRPAAPPESGQGPSGRSPGPAAGARPEIAAQPAPPRPATAAPSVAGEYALISYSERGNLLPLTGVMRLTEMQPGSYQFDTLVKNMRLGVTFQYRGVLAGGATWSVTTMQTNDPNALVATPIATSVRFDGSTLAIENEYAQGVWRKR